MTSTELAVSCEMARWKKELSDVVIRFEREESLRAGKRFEEPRRPAHLPADLLALMNWKVWAARYYIDVGFVARAVLEKFRFSRRRGEEPSLGLPAAMASGPSARAAVEEAVRRAFPCGENVKSSRRRSAIAAPIGGLNYETPEQMVREYAAAMAKRQAALEDPRARSFRPVLFGGRTR